MLKCPVDFKSFRDTYVPAVFDHYGWKSLVPILVSANSTLIKLFYSNFIELGLDNMFLETSINGKIIHVTPIMIAQELDIPTSHAPSTSQITITDEVLERAATVFWGSNCDPIGSVVKLGSLSKAAWVLGTFLHCIYPSTHRAGLTRLDCVIISCVMHQEPFDLASSILEHMIPICDTIAYQKEVLPFGLLITKLCLKADIELAPSTSTHLIPSMGPIYSISWNRSQWHTSAY